MKKIFILATLLMVLGCSMYEFKDPTGAQSRILYSAPEQANREQILNERLKQLKELFDTGLITEQEYNVSKQKLINDLK